MMGVVVDAVSRGADDRRRRDRGDARLRRARQHRVHAAASPRSRGTVKILLDLDRILGRVVGMLLRWREAGRHAAAGDPPFSRSATLDRPRSADDHRGSSTRRAASRCTRASGSSSRRGCRSGCASSACSSRISDYLTRRRRGCVRRRADAAARRDRDQSHELLPRSAALRASSRSRSCPSGWRAATAPRLDGWCAPSRPARSR